MKFNQKLSFILVGMLLFSGGIMGQTTLEVVTKTIEKTMPYKNGTEVNIEGEKAEILVETWDHNEVKVLIELIAKHPDRSVAEADLDLMSYSTEQHGGNIYFRNYVDKNNGKPKADLKAIYTITLPADCPVYMKNTFGMAQVSNLQNRLTINSEFSSIDLENLSGEIGLQTRFGDIEGRNIDGVVKVSSRRSDITLYDIRGKWDIHSQYGILKFFTNPTDDLLTMNIEAEKSDVYFFDPVPSQSGYTLTAHYGNISVPQDLKFNFLENSNQLKKAIFSSNIGKSNISVKISFGDITIRNP